MKKYNIKIYEKIKSNDVGEDASVCLEKNQNNIRTFVKSKSNAVGEASLDDPLKKKKHTNKIMSNDILKDYSTFLKIEKDNKTGRRGRRPLQMPKSNFGITLIALIITIIVLLILAGVTLNMVMGENGIFGKANNAKNKTEVAQYEEELRMCVLELQTDAAANGETFNMETIKNKFVEKVKELENTIEIEFPTKESETRLDGTYKGYEFYIDDKYAAHIGDKATGISLTTSINPSGWTQGPVTATITIKSNNGLSKIVSEGETEINLNGEKEYIITKTNIEENTSYEYAITDGQGNTQNKTAVINTIDKNSPADFTITAENTEEGLKITGEATDAESGIDKYEYYVKKSDGEYKAYESNPITELASGTYNVYAIAYDKAGNSKVSNKVDVTITIVFAQIEAGNQHNLAIDKNGKLWSWGGNNGVLEDGETTMATAGYRNWGPAKMKLELNVKEVSVGNFSHSLIIDKNGKLWSRAYINNSYGQLGNGTMDLSKKIIKINDEIFLKIAASETHNLAIDKDGNLWSWGKNNEGQLGDGTDVNKLVPTKIIIEKKFTQISCGDYLFSLAIDNEGNLYSWGYNVYGQLGNQTTNTKMKPEQIIKGTKFTQISAGYDFALALDREGNLWSWGNNDHGQLGRGGESAVPSIVKEGTKFTQISAGENHCLAIDKDGNLWSWGRNFAGQLGDGTTSDHTYPEIVKIDKKITQISAGEMHSLALDSNGVIWGWGSNGMWELGENNRDEFLTPIQIIPAY